jgi:hypothetical protein
LILVKAKLWLFMSVFVVDVLDVNDTSDMLSRV